jgi:hypothetical protein
MSERFWLNAAVASGSYTPKTNSWTTCNREKCTLIICLLCVNIWFYKIQNKIKQQKHINETAKKTSMTYTIKLSSPEW